MISTVPRTSRFGKNHSAGWCNGNTTDFGSVIHGSSPCPVASQTLLKPTPLTAAINPEYLPRGKHLHQQNLLTSVTSTTIILLARFFSGYSVRWVDCQPDTCQRIYFANHSSHLDAVVLWSALPAEIRNLTRPVAAQDYWSQNRFRRFLASAFNAILIDRKEIKVHQSPVDLMLKEIGDIYSLIVFPEGGRTESGTMGEFKSGIYYLAKKRPDIELVPVYMENLNRILPRGEVLPVPLLSNITIGSPIWLEAGEPKSAFLVRAREAVLALRDA